MTTMTARVAARSAWALVAAAAIFLTGCRAEEQGRPLVHEKGVYAGPADEPLTDEVREQLKQRARKQAF